MTQISELTAFVTWALRKAEPPVAEGLVPNAHSAVQNRGKYWMGTQNELKMGGGFVAWVLKQLV